MISFNKNMLDTEYRAHAIIRVGKGITCHGRSMLISGALEVCGELKTSHCLVRRAPFCANAHGARRAG